MEDYKYWAIVTGTPSWEEEVIKTEALKPPCSIFTWHMLRTANLAALPAMMAFLTTKEQLIVSNAMFKEFKRGGVHVTRRV